MEARHKSPVRILLVALAMLVAMSLCATETSLAASKRPEQVKVIKATTTYNSITLNWKASANASEYIVYRATSKYGIYNELKTVTKTTYTDTKLQTGKALWYKIRAVGDKGRARKSPRISAVPTLGAPVVQAEANGEGITLSWEKVDGADGYVLYRDGKSLATQKSLTYIDSEVYAGKEHKYKVNAYRYVEHKVVASPFSREIAATRPSMSLKLKGNNTVPDLTQGDSFTFEGKIKSNTRLKKVTAGIVDAETDKWVEDQKFTAKDVGEMTFDLSQVNEKLAVDKLPAGSYYYKVIVQLVSGAEKTLLNQGFEVAEPPLGDLIVAKALECAWPYGTPRSKFRYGSGVRTDAYTEALQVAYGSRSGWGKQTAAGASCDVFVGTVIRASGVDTSFPRGLDDVVGYCKKHPEKWENTGITSESDMKPGDVVYQRFKSGGGHICIYLGDGKVANAHYVSKTYAVVEKFSSKVKSPGSVKTHIVYRAVQ